MTSEYCLLGARARNTPLDHLPPTPKLAVAIIEFVKAHQRAASSMALSPFLSCGGVRPSPSRFDRSARSRFTCRACSRDAFA